MPYPNVVDPAVTTVAQGCLHTIDMRTWPEDVLLLLAREFASSCYELIGTDESRVVLPMPNLLYLCSNLLLREDDTQVAIPQEIRLIRLITEMHRLVEVELLVRAHGIATEKVALHRLIARTR